MTLATSGVSGAQALGVPVNSPQTLTADDYEAERIQSTTEAHEYRSDVPSNSSETPARPTCQGWTLIRILEAGERFRHIPRISALRPQDELWQAIREHETAGIPLIIEDWHKHPQWPSNMFDVEWLVQNCPDEVLHVRNMHDRLDRDMLLPEFIERSRKQPAYVSPDEVERFYGKDAFCPPEWKIWLEQSEVLPAPVIPCGTNDILQHLPESSSVESLMCYLGIGDTFTPCHKDLCASSGQNIMCYTENGGSSYWFMTASSDAPAAAAYFSNTLGQELDWETHVATVREFAAAPFTVYVAEQKVGDLVLVPPRSCHQVVNHGGLTVKMSWSRMTVRGLQTALRHELPLYRRVCRPEQYRVKSLLHRTLLQYTTELEEILARTSDSPSGSSRGDSAVDLTKQSARLSDLETLIQLFEELLCEEYTKSHASLSQIIHSTRGWAVVPGPMRAAGTTLILRPPSTIPGTLADDHGDKQSYNFACDFCGADMFQSFFECRDCVLVQDVDAVLGNGDGLLICAPCYVEGRSCLCEEMEPVQCRPFGDLLRDRNRAAEAIVRCHGTSDTKYKIWTESDLANGPHLAVFEAACLLHKLRKDAGPKLLEDRSCRARPDTHRVSYISTVYCTPCHASRCWEHVLQDGLHVAEGLLFYTSDQALWHRRHRESKNEFERALPAVEEAERTGAYSDLRLRLVMAAQRYRKCKPVSATFTRLGWYDIPESEGVEEDYTGDDDVQHSKTSSRHTPDEQVVDGHFDSPLTPIAQLPDSPVLYAMPLTSLSSSDLTSVGRDDFSDEGGPGEHMDVVGRSLGIAFPTVMVHRIKTLPSDLSTSAAWEGEEPKITEPLNTRTASSQPLILGFGYPADCGDRRTDRQKSSCNSEDEDDFVNDSYAESLAQAINNAYSGDFDEGTLNHSSPAREPQSLSLSRKRPALIIRKKQITAEPAERDDKEDAVQRPLKRRRSEPLN